VSSLDTTLCRAVQITWSGFGERIVPLEADHRYIAMQDRVTVLQSPSRRMKKRFIEGRPTRVATQPHLRGEMSSTNNERHQTLGKNPGNAAKAGFSTLNETLMGRRGSHIPPRVSASSILFANLRQNWPSRRLSPNHMLKARNAGFLRFEILERLRHMSRSSRFLPIFDSIANSMGVEASFRII